MAQNRRISYDEKVFSAVLKFTLFQNTVMIPTGSYMDYNPEHKTNAY